MTYTRLLGEDQYRRGRNVSAETCPGCRVLSASLRTLEYVDLKGTDPYDRNR